MYLKPQILMQGVSRLPYKVGLNLIGSISLIQPAIYDITEYLYGKDLNYVITNNNADFIKSLSLTNAVTIKSTTQTNIQSLLDLNRSAKKLGNINICHIPIFSNRLYAPRRNYICNGLFIFEYSLADTYDRKKQLISNLVDFMQTEEMHLHRL